MAGRPREESPLNGGGIETVTKLKKGSRSSSWLAYHFITKAGRWEVDCQGKREKYSKENGGEITKIALFCCNSVALLVLFQPSPFSSAFIWLVRLHTFPSRMFFTFLHARLTSGNSTPTSCWSPTLYWCAATDSKTHPFQKLCGFSNQHL